MTMTWRQINVPRQQFGIEQKKKIQQLNYIKEEEESRGLYRMCFTGIRGEASESLDSITEL